ncbi:MAG: hypothetical protein KJZ78_03895 [Bryobacteraceae bacterium]|nr:hypothetical protein [Bryobacteraceae bacterium]
MGRDLRFRLSSRSRQLLGELDRALESCYATPEAELDNKQDPLEEAIYIILSFQTDLDRFRKVWLDLYRAFPSWEHLARAPLRAIARVLRIGGLQQQKAKTIKKLLKAVSKVTGCLSLEPLRAMGDQEAERVLTNLPGLSWKGARCVLLYSLNRPAFPVDGNTFRIFKRIGILPAGAVYRRRTLHDGLQAAVDEDRRKPFHINLVVHGQRTCLPRNPRCSACVVRHICLQRGVPPEIKAATRAIQPQGSSHVLQGARAGAGGLLGYFAVQNSATGVRQNGK